CPTSSPIRRAHSQDPLVVTSRKRAADVCAKSSPPKLEADTDGHRSRILVHHRRHRIWTGGTKRPDVRLVAVDVIDDQQPEPKILVSATSDVNGRFSLQLSAEQVLRL